MLYISETLLQHREMETFDDLCEVVRQKARDGELHLRLDIKPSFADTPQDWEDRLEAAFSGVV